MTAPGQLPAARTLSLVGGCRSGAHRRVVTGLGNKTASGLAAVEVRDRVVETVKTVTVVQHHSIEKPIPYRPTSAAAFVEILDDLTARLDSGRLYDRDLPNLVTAVRGVIDALNRREQAAARHLW